MISETKRNETKYCEIRPKFEIRRLKIDLDKEEHSSDFITRIMECKRYLHKGPNEDYF